MRYSKHSLRKRRNKSCLASGCRWSFKEGVFKTPRGKWIARVFKKVNGGFVTLSQHDTKEEAQAVYDGFYANNEVSQNQA